MPMTKPFVPHKPEKTTEMKVSLREVSLIKKLRKYPFGEFVVFKANNILVRVEIKDSQLIKEEDEKEKETS